MKYEPIIARLEAKYPKHQRGGMCLDISESLALLILTTLPKHRVSTVQGLDLKGNNKPVFYSNHYVTVVQEPEGKFVGLDATRPTYEAKENFWMFEASSETELENALSKHYKGNWKIQNNG